MRVRVELRRRDGRFIARYGMQQQVIGDLRLVRESVADRQITVLCVYPERQQHTVPSNPFQSPEDVPNLFRLTMFEPRLTLVDGNSMRFLGYEATKEHAWVVQEWDCTLT